MNENIEINVKNNGYRASQFPDTALGFYLRNLDTEIVHRYQ